MGGVGPRSTPTIAGGRVYALGATGILQCLEGSTGKLVWEHNLLEIYGLTQAESELEVMWGRAASPLVVDDLVVVPAGGKSGKTRSLVAFRAEDGEKVWEAGTDQIAYASPSLATLGGQRQIVIVNEKTVTGHDPATGKQLWSEARQQLGRRHRRKPSRCRAICCCCRAMAAGRSCWSSARSQPRRWATAFCRQFNK
jgi:outer membrane protein assembly factor BamB